MLILFCFILYTILHNYLLAPWSSVLLEKLTGSQLVKKFAHLMETIVSLHHSQVPPTVPILSPHQWINPGLRHRIIFCNMIRFLQWGVYRTSPKLEAGVPPLVGFPRLLIQYIRSYPSYWTLFLHPQTEDVPCCGVRYPLNLAKLHTMMELL